jgi:hypothetical protein
MRQRFMVRNAKDLSPEQRTVIESLLGRRIKEDETVSVRAIEPHAASEETRRKQAEQLKQYFAEVDARRNAGSPEDADAILNEAIRSVRPGYRLHR